MHSHFPDFVKKKKIRTENPNEIFIPGGLEFFFWGKCRGLGMGEAKGLPKAKPRVKMVKSLL